MSAFHRSHANTYSNLSLDRAAEWRDRDELMSLRALASSARYLLLRHDGSALVDAESWALRFLVAVERPPTTATASFLGHHADTDYFVAVVDDDDIDTIALRFAARWLDLRSAGSRLSSFDAGLFAYARALAHWQARTRFCPVCGAALRLVSAGHRGHCSNEACGVDQFPRTDAAIIAIVSRDDACLLGRQANWPERRYSTLAGFVEPGETLEDAVCREVFEEAGIIVDDCEYHSSQPWPFPASLMVGFVAHAASETINLGSELEDARWFTANELVRTVRSGELRLPPPISVSHQLIGHWLHAQAGIELADVIQKAPR